MQTHRRVPQGSQNAPRRNWHAAHNTNARDMATDADIDDMLTRIVNILTQVEHETMRVDVPCGMQQLRLFRRRFYRRARARFPLPTYHTIVNCVRFHRAMYPMHRAAL